jgi:hypothetical protein
VSPIESRNQIENGHLTGHSNLIIEKGIDQMTEYTQDRLLSLAL